MLAGKTYLLVSCYHKLIRKAIAVVPKQRPKYGDLALTSLIIEAQEHDSTINRIRYAAFKGMKLESESDFAPKSKQARISSCSRRWYSSKISFSVAP
jgi:ribosomal protein L14E/L6E/L27E